jgi:hypothetical protein
MRITRRKVSAPYQDLVAELDRLLRLDANNQAAFAAGIEARGGIRITRHQLHMMTESIFFTAFRAYECFLGDIFQLYCLEKRPRSGMKVKSYLKPKDFDHAGKLLKSSMQFLDWTSPEIVIKRAETYLDKGFPIKLPYTTHRSTLLDLKRLRNQIAHDSRESINGYMQVLRSHFLMIPLVTPSPGEFLLLPSRINPAKYNLQIYLEFLKNIAAQLS